VELLRDGLLEGTTVLVIDAGYASSPGQVADSAEWLGARVSRSVPDVLAQPGGVDIQPDAVDMLVVDGAALFAAGGLGACMAGAWEATRAVVNCALLPAARGGRIVYLAPAPGAGEQSDAARAGLENLARTLSVEWARHEITVVTIALGDSTAPGEAAALCAYLASPAGAYFSGCLLDLRGV
jgi:NAD(P)-dependent dehydrogenase (short-subunit alcohol dehydrogenase family)